MSFVLYRLALSDPETFREALGDEITSTGGAPVPAIRTALRHQAAIFTLGPEAEDTVAERFRIRRQLRSLMNNTPFKLSGYYVLWSVDKERDGWYMPDKGELEDGSGSIGVATGWFKMAQFVWFKVGKPTTHRRAMWVYLKDLRTGLFARDYRKQIYSTDFSTLTALNLTYLPPGATDVSSAASGAEVGLIKLPAEFDGGECQLAVGLVDNLRVSYEQTPASRNLGQVIAYDRRGTFTAPAKEVGAGWEEMYGPDYPYNWVEGGAIDTPVLTNGLCRVYYDGAGTPGWQIDVWTGTAWENQCKVRIERRAVANNFDTVLLSASLVEYSETSAVIQAVMSTPADVASREVVYINLQRGWSGPRFEIYPALKANGEQAGAAVQPVFTADTDDSIIKIDAANVGVINATAKGTGHTGYWVSAALGVESFTGSENDVIIGRWGKAYGMVVAVVQEAALVYVDAGGSGTQALEVICPAAGYASARFGFPKQQVQQAMEAESMTLGSGTANTVDAEASGGHAATATRTTDANAHVTQATWPNGHSAKYRVFAHVKTSASTLHVYAKTTGTTGAAKTTTEKTYVWIDLGDIVANNSTLEIHCWATAAATVSVDRIETFLLEDRTTAESTYDGGRDLGQSVLVDSRTIPTVVTRSI